LQILRELETKLAVPSTLNNEGWKQQVQLREQKSLAGLIDFMGRVANLLTFVLNNQS